VSGAPTADPSVGPSVVPSMMPVSGAPTADPSVGPSVVVPSTELLTFAPSGASDDASTNGGGLQAPTGHPSIKFLHGGVSTFFWGLMLSAFAAVALFCFGLLGCVFCCLVRRRRRIQEAKKLRMSQQAVAAVGGDEEADSDSDSDSDSEASYDGDDSGGGYDSNFDSDSGEDIYGGSCDDCDDHIGNRHGDKEKRKHHEVLKIVKSTDALANTFTASSKPNRKLVGERQGGVAEERVRVRVRGAAVPDLDPEEVALEMLGEMEALRSDTRVQKAPRCYGRRVGARSASLPADREEVLVFQL
jgi:hypothetical protein